MIDVVVIGGGPSGAVAASLLASWGHTVTLVTQAIDPARGLANSLPPSTRKLLDRVGILAIVERVGYPTTGNTVWWGDDERVESFSGDRAAYGYQVFRPALDPLLLEHAGACGVRVIRDATVTQAKVGGGGARVAVRASGADTVLDARFALDCSGRSGVIARQGWRLPPDCQMQALLGSWRRPGGWAIADASHTSVETYDDGWAWTVPISATERHAGVIVHGGRSRLVRGPSIDATYRTELSKSARIAAQVSDAELGDVWACDASLYSSSCFAGPAFLLIGDAASTIDPLSSFGVKKALASAWLGAVAAHTRLIDGSRDVVASQFFSQWETRVYDTHLRRSRDFAIEAYQRHPSAFWQAQAAIPVRPPQSDPDDERVWLRDPLVGRALTELREQPLLRAERAASIGWVRTGLIRGNEVVEDVAIPIEPSMPLRYLKGVDLIGLAELAPLSSQVPDLFARYVREHHPVPLADFLAALSFLFARGVLRHLPGPET